MFFDFSGTERRFSGNTEKREVLRYFFFFLVLALILLYCQDGYAEETSANEIKFSNRKEESYYSLRDSYIYPVYQHENVELQLNECLHPGEELSFDISVPEDACYEIWFTYINSADDILAAEFSLRIDGKILFSEMNGIQLKSLWVDNGIFPEDRYGNQRSTETYSMEVPLETGLCDASGRTLSPFLFELGAGSHQITVIMKDGTTEIRQVSLRKPTQLKEYTAEEASGDQCIVIEGENIHGRNDSSIRADGIFDASVHPTDSEQRVMNYLAGGSFSAPGDVVTYQFEVEEDGWYHIGMNYRQSSREDFSVYLDILIDGQIPNVAAQAVEFAYKDSFEFSAAEYEGQTISFWLEKGTHELSLRINADCLLPVYQLIDKMTEEINALYMKIVLLTCGTTADKFRYYNIAENIPDMESILTSWAAQCDETLEYVRNISPNGKTTAFTYLQLCSKQLLSLAEEPENVPRRISELSTGSNSVAKYLSQLLQDISNNAIDIDRIYLYQDSAEFPDESGFWDDVSLQIDRFFNSFDSQAYSSSNGQEGHLQVWMGESRSLVELLQSIVDSDFTAKTGIMVDLSIMPGESKLVLSNAAGTAPDVALSMTSVMPSYLDVRGALYDLTQFEDFAEIADRFSSNLFLPYIHETGVYALPQQINVWLLFYREDILDSLGLEIPQTLDDVKEMIPELQARNMNFYYPTAGMGGTKYFAGTLPIINQAGGDIYGEMVERTLLDSEESLNGFKELTELFTIYSLPIDSGSGFYQRFRDGTLPIGISDLGTYILLENAAPELKGLWSIALIPGLQTGDGSVQRYINGDTKAMGIMADTDMPNEAWEFMKWWSSDEIQTKYANLLYTVYGSDIMWVSANYDALFKLPLKKDDMEIIKEQVAWIKDPQWCLGTYMVERELSNAFLSVTVDQEDARQALDKAVKNINRETYRKLEEFGYYKDGVKIRDYLAPDAGLIDRIVENYMSTAEEENR